jgi:hypothetical protein
MNDTEFMFAQTIKGLNQYIKKCGLQPPKNRKKSKIVEFILDNIDIETGNLK